MKEYYFSYYWESKGMQGYGSITAEIDGAITKDTIASIKDSIQTDMENDHTIIVSWQPLA